ncbi:hypothetical protein LF1_35190 [Rubripirellula obstinata]|uniref:Uncharacterized protein n=1 Tax=Rubripirellula obstinata TaxID=406547 RepID=A0A5B1CII3_9BACT|nr:hypothetical protein [Rubripirellula obstinata]KAA1260977.1 hypothetical protein LF1_35190 [Rubripirellula obstinata]
MWHSSRGDRTLQGGEAALVSAAIDTMIDALMVHLDDHDEVDLNDGYQSIPDCESGINVYDRLNACQRIGLLHQLANYLLADTSRAPKLTATSEAGVAAIFVEIRDQLAIELDLETSLAADDSFYWRRMVVDALHELADDAQDIDDVPTVVCRELSVWEDAVDQMVSAILWDRDFEMADGFLDQDPVVSQQRRKLLGIDTDYFTGVSPDPRPNEARKLIRETRSIVRSKPR